MSDKIIKQALRAAGVEDTGRTDPGDGKFMQDKHPYLVSGLVFLVIFFVGQIFFQWGQMASTFLVLFFLLVIIGIRLDEIVKKINAVNDRLEGLARDCLHDPASDDTLRNGD